MDIGEEQVRLIAQLAQLELDAGSVATMQASMKEILSLVEQMQELDTEGIQPMMNPLDAMQRLRSDDVTEADRREEYQELAPESDSGLYLVPRVVE